MSTANTEKSAQQRHVLQKIAGIATSDGDGVKLTRIIARRQVRLPLHYPHCPCGAYDR